MQKRSISVLVITYNHEPFIAAALDSILAQQVDADLEIIVADDASTDGTVSVVKTYQEKHPGQIVLLGSSTNLGHTRNYARAWDRAHGDYIAHCDGDDYWTDNFKLAKQLEFLENHPEFSSCANKISVICDGQVLEQSHPKTDKEEFSSEDLLDACYPHNSSLFFRNRLFKELPDFFFELTGHDWCISVLNSLHGPLKMLPETMSVWRIRSNGLWGGRQDDFHLEHTRLFLTSMANFLPERLHRTIHQYTLRNYFQLAEHNLKTNNIEKARFYFKKLLTWDSFRFLPLRPIFSISARIYCLPVYCFLKQVRNLTLGEPPAA